MGSPHFLGLTPTVPSARYVLLNFEERTPYEYKRQGPYARFSGDRIIFLGVRVDDTSTDDIVAQLLILESQGPDSPIAMYINSPDGSFTALTVIYDTMQYIKPRIQTVCLNQTASTTAILLAAGLPGQRLALPNARVLIHEPAMGGMQGQASDITIVADEFGRVNDWLCGTLLHHSGKPVDEIKSDIKRDKILTANGAREYGLVDQVLASREAPPGS